MTPEARIERTERLLREACRQAGAWVSGDGRIGLETAAELLGWSVSTMQNRLCNGTAPPHYRLPGRGHRTTFSLRDLAEFVEGCRSY